MTSTAAFVPSAPSLKPASDSRISHGQRASRFCSLRRLGAQAASCSKELEAGAIVFARRSATGERRVFAVAPFNPRTPIGRNTASALFTGDLSARSRRLLRQAVADCQTRKDTEVVVCVQASADDGGLIASGAEGALSADTRSKYTYWRYRVFIGLIVGFTASYFTRGCFTYAAPILRNKGLLTLQDIGVINSVFMVTQGISKFTSGIIADRVDPRYFLAIGLVATGILDAALCIYPNVYWMTFIIALIGWLSQFVVPACAKLMTVWYSATERGGWWGLWNMGANFGGFLVALVAGYCANTFSWQYGMYIPGLIGIACGLLSFFLIKTDPGALGLPAVEVYRGEEAPKAKGTAAPAASAADKNQLVMQYVLKNPLIWIMGISWGLVYFIRQGVTSWSHFYLMDVKGVASASDAAARVSGRELGGLVGGLSAGWISDKVFGGRRVPVIILYTVGIALSVFAFWRLPGGVPVLDYLTITVLGFFIYGPQMLIGLAGTEFAPKSVASTAIGLVGLLSYAGATFSGAPITMLVKKYGWNSFFLAMIICCGAIIALCVPIWNRRSFDVENASKK